MRFKWTTISRICLAVFAVSLLVLMGNIPGWQEKGLAKQLDNHQQPMKEPQHMTVILERVYVDGEISQEMVEETFWSEEKFWAKYDQWQLTDMDESTMVFRRTVDDISPLLKTNGYFGITDNGVLTIFNGRPGQSRIIQSFFQIDIRKLESTKQEELLKGIPIKTKDRYVEVLETFKPYTIKK